MVAGFLQNTNFQKHIGIFRGIFEEQKINKENNEVSGEEVG